MRLVFVFEGLEGQVELVDCFEDVYSDGLEGGSCFFRVGAVVVAVSGAFAADGAIAERKGEVAAFEEGLPLDFEGDVLRELFICRVDDDSPYIFFEYLAVFPWLERAGP